MPPKPAEVDWFSAPEKTALQPVIEVQGHTAVVRRWQRKRGLFRPRMITFVEEDDMSPAKAAARIRATGLKDTDALKRKYGAPAALGDAQPATSPTG